MYEKVQEVVNRYEELSRLLSSPDIRRTPDLIRKYGVEQASIIETVDTYRRYLQLVAEIEETSLLLDEEQDDDMRTMISDEVISLQEALAPIEDKLKALIAPRDPRDDRDVIIEIRAGAGGDEAGLFGGDLFRMYSVYAANMGWTVEIMSSNETGIGVSPSPAVASTRQQPRLLCCPRSTMWMLRFLTLTCVLTSIAPVAKGDRGSILLIRRCASPT